MSTAFQPNAFQPDAFQVEGGVASGEITGGLGYTNRDDTFVGHAVLAGDDLTAAKYGARKRKANPNIRFKPATAKASPPVSAPEPKKPKVKPSPLVLGLLARGLVPPEPPEPAPVLVVASIPSVTAPEIVAAIEVPKPEVPPAGPTLEQLATTVGSLEAQLQALRAELAAVRAMHQPEPVAPTARDPVHEALHALLPAIADPIDLDAEPEQPEPLQPVAQQQAAPAPTPRPRMSRAQIEAENERRAALAVKLLIESL